MLEQINDFFGRVFSFLQAHPKYGLPVAILLAGIYLLGAHPKLEMDAPAQWCKRFDCILD